MLNHLSLSSPSTFMESLLNLPFLDESSFLHLPFTLWKNIVLISSITTFNVFVFALILFLWATNRQTQIRPSKSQSRPTSGPERKGKKVLEQSIKKESGLSLLEDLDEDDNSSSDQQDLFSTDWGRKKSRENLLRSFSMEFEIEEDEDDDDSGSEESEFLPLARGEPDTNNYGNYCDISFGEEDKTATTSNLSPQFQTMRQDIRNFISNMNLFSYLSDDALMEILKYMRYIDLAKEGSPILCSYADVKKNSDSTCSDSSESPTAMKLINDEELDGSLYIVIDGTVDCSCHLDGEMIDMVDGTNQHYPSNQHTKLHFSAGPGDLITSQLAIVSDLVRHFQNVDAEEGQCIHPVVVKARTSQPNTRILCVPSISYLTVLEKFPHEVHQLTQTILSRTQRVTMQTLVKNFGLTDEIIGQKYGSWKKATLNNIQETGDWHKNLEDCQQQIKLHDSESKDNKNYFSSADNAMRTLEVPEEIMQSISSLAAKKLGTMKESDIEHICRHSSIVSVNASSTIVQTGKKSNYLYFLISGELEIGNFIASISDKGLERTMTRPFGSSMKDFKLNVKELEKKKSLSFQTAHTMQAGEFVGQLAAYTGEVSMASIRVSPNIKESATLLEIPKSVYMNLLTANNVSLIQSLRSILQSDFSPVVHLLDWGLKWRDIHTGFALAQKGDICQSTFVVLNGRLRSGNKRHISGPVMKEEHGRGSCIGEVQVLTGASWPDDVYAIRDSELAEVPLSVLEFIMNIFPTCGVHFARVIANQVQQRYMKKEKTSLAPSSSGLPSYQLSVATIAVIPMCFGSDINEITKFCEKLTACLRKIAPCATMTKSLARNKLGKCNLKNIVYAMKLSRMLGDLEENNRLVVYQAESQFNWWTKTCIEHSDCVMLIVDSQKTPDSTHMSVLRFLAQTQSSYLNKRVEIVILDKKSEDGKAKRAQGLDQWIDDLPFETGNNLIRVKGMNPVEADENDMKRMCRRITGCSLGLALGGGGARGIAHLGVIKALLEAGVLVSVYNIYLLCNNGPSIEPHTHFSYHIDRYSWWYKSGSVHRGKLIVLFAKLIRVGYLT